jgi:2-desacetyl-2-hydroxyethyl bacteriochlorophyllide A dehydrogenase
MDTGKTELSASTGKGTARAVWFTAPRLAEICEEAVQAPGPDEIQVSALYSLISAGSEMNLFRGEGNLPGLLVPKATGTLPFPVKFAYQTVGRLEIAGNQSGYQKGDMVFAVHPHQERFTISANPLLVHRLPPAVDPVKAVFLNMFTVGVHCHLEVPVRIGDCVAVSGLGLVGAFSGYLARFIAGKLILIDPLNSRRERAAWIKADAVVHPEDALSAVMELSGGRGADIFIESSGAPPALQTAIACTGAQGTIVVSSWYGTREVRLSLSPEFHLRGLKIISIYVGQPVSSIASRWHSSRIWDVALDHLNRIDVNQLISHTLPFDRAPEAYGLLDRHPDEVLGVLMEYGKY